MAGARALGKKRGVKGRPAAGKSGPKPMAIAIKGEVAWRDWVERLAEHNRTDVAKLVDAALVLYARETGFGEPAPKR